MRWKVEVWNKHVEPGRVDDLLYTPRREPVGFRRVKVYLAFGSGDLEAFERWMRRVVDDPVALEFRLGDGPAISGADCILEYGMKPGALDHERETLLAEYREEGGMILGFNLEDLRLRTRLYFFPEDDRPFDPAGVIRDVVNPAIHSHDEIRPGV